MFLPKPVVALLFLVAIVSTGGVLYLLSQRPSVPERTPVATTTVFVTPSVSPSPVQSPAATQSAGFVADSSWKTATSSALSISVDYPSNWSASASESASLVVYSPVLTTIPYVTITREKKNASSDTITKFVASREDSYKEKSYALKDSKKNSIDDYSAIDRVYAQNDTQIREVVFGTKNYFYIISITPQPDDTNKVVDEVLRSVNIL